MSATSPWLVRRIAELGLDELLVLVVADPATRRDDVRRDTARADAAGVRGRSRSRRRARSPCAAPSTRSRSGVRPTPTSSSARTSSPSSRAGSPRARPRARATRRRHAAGRVPRATSTRCESDSAPAIASSSSRWSPSRSRRRRFVLASHVASRSTDAFRLGSLTRSHASVSTRAGVDCEDSDEDARETELTPLEQARRTAALCQEKLATDVTILDMRGVCDFTDFFVIATGRNARQTKAIYDEVAGVLKKEHELLPRSSRRRDRGDLDRRRLPRRRAAPLHARDAELLPARGAVERRPVRRGRSRRRRRSSRRSGMSSAAAPVRLGVSGRRGSRTPTPPSASSEPPGDAPPKSARTNRAIRPRRARSRRLRGHRCMGSG